MHASLFNYGVLGALALAVTACGSSLADEPNAPSAEVKAQLCYDLASDQRPHSFAADFALARYGADGRLDRTFGVEGVAAVDGGDDREAISALIAETDSVVAAGYSSEGAIALMRFQRDGSLDSTFGTDGITLTSLYSEAEAAQIQPSEIVDPMLNEQVNLVAMANGDLLALAERPHPDRSDRPGYGRQDLVLLRYDSTGQLDSGFGDGGRAVVELGGQASVYDVVQQPDGKLVVVGRLDAGVAPQPDQMLVGRLLPDGMPDESFGRDGWVMLDLNHEDVATSVAIAPDGDIWVGGYWRPRFGPNFPLQVEPPVWSLLRLNPDGSRNRDTARTGMLRGDRRGDRSTSIRVLETMPDGTVLAASPGHLLAQYQPQQRILDPLALPQGQVAENFLYPHDAVIQTNQITLLGGGAYATINDCPHLSRYSLDGTLDEEFGDSGYVPLTPDLNRSLTLDSQGNALWIGGNTVDRDSQAQ